MWTGFCGLRRGMVWIKEEVMTYDFWKNAPFKSLENFCQNMFTSVDLALLWKALNSNQSATQHLGYFSKISWRFNISLLRRKSWPRTNSKVRQTSEWDSSRSVQKIKTFISIRQFFFLSEDLTQTELISENSTPRQQPIYTTKKLSRFPFFALFFPGKCFAFFPLKSFLFSLWPELDRSHNWRFHTRSSAIPLKKVKNRQKVLERPGKYI